MSETASTKTTITDLRARATTRIPASQARPGDLMTWGHPATHIAIYLGDGLIIAAPKPGDRVKVQGLYGSFEFHRVA